MWRQDLTGLDWRKTKQPSSILWSRGRGEGKAAPYPSCSQRAHSFVLYSPPAPGPCGSFQDPRSFPFYLPPRALQRVHRADGDRERLRVSWSYHEKASPPSRQVFCSRYRYLQSQLHWQHTQRILGALLNSQAEEEAFTVAAHSIASPCLNIYRPSAWTTL